jgi:hypothetical protein
MKVLGVSVESDSQKGDCVCMALCESTDTGFEFSEPQRMAFSPPKWRELHDSLTAYFSARRDSSGVEVIGLLKRSSGKYSAAPETYKAEGLVELVGQQLGLPIEYVTPHSLKKALACDAATTWQKRAREIFNGDRKIKHFADGIDGAIAAAYKVCNG